MSSREERLKSLRSATRRAAEMDEVLSKRVSDMEEMVKSACAQLELSAQRDSPIGPDVFTTPVVKEKKKSARLSDESDSDSQRRDDMSRYIRGHLTSSPMEFRLPSQEMRGAGADPLVEKFRAVGLSLGLSGGELSRFVSAEIRLEK